MTATAATQLDGENPWPGLESFEENARGFFYGRDREAETLLDHVLDAPVTVLYGRSGLGKTSLLRAGLFPLLRDRQFLPVYVRLELKPGAAPLTRQLHQSVHNSIRADVPDAMLPSDEESLWEYLHRADFELWSARNYPLTPVIVLDQFEELFTLGERVSDLVQEFRNNLGDLAENRIPADLAARIEDDEAVAGRFHLRSRNYKFLISLREDFLPELDEWRGLIPALGRSRVRLLPLRAGDAFDAVHKPAEHLMTAALAHRVVGIVAGEDLHRGGDIGAADARRPVGHLGASEEVEPALLSLFCRELNEERKRRGRPHFDEQLVEDAKRGILSNYYSSCVRDLPPRVADFIESELITEKGFRDSYVREDAVPSRLTDDELARLIGSRLVRLEDRYGAQRIELTHDVLTGVVREHRDRRRAEEEKAALAARAEQERQALAQAAAQHEAELDRERLIERERRLESEALAARRLRWLTAALAVVTIAAAVLAVVAVINARSAEVARAAAADAARDATALRLIAESQTLLAGLAPGGIDDVLGMQELLAALAIPSSHRGATYPLLRALYQERDLLKVIDVPEVVSSVTFSPDGTRIASANGDNSVQLWNPDTGAPIDAPLTGHTDAVLGVAFSPDGTRLASGSADKTVRLWNPDTGQPIGAPLTGHTDAVLGVVFSPDGTRIASGSADNTVRLWDTNGKPIGQPLRHDDWVTSVTFSPDGTRIASGSYDKTVRLWDTNGKPIGQPLRHDDSVNSVAFSPDGTRIASGAAKTVRLWDAGTGRPIGEPLRHNDWVTSAVFSPDGARIASGSYDKTIRLWDAATGEGQIGVLRGHQSPVTALAFHPNGLHLVSSGSDLTVRLWDTSWQPLLGHTGTAWANYFDDGRRIGSGGFDKSVRWWDATTGRPIGEPLRVDDDDVEVLFPVDEDRLLSFGKIDTVRLWDARSRKPIGEPLRLPPDPNRLVVADDTTSPRIAAQLEPGVVQLWNTNLRPVGDTIRLDQPVSMIAFSRDGRMMATGSVDGTIRLWDSGTGAPIGQPMKGDSYVTSIAFSHDGHLLATGQRDNTVRLWDTGTFQPVGDPMYLDSFSRAAAFTPDGRTFASGSDDGTISLWNVGDQTPLGAPLTGHTASVTSLYFSPDGTKVLSASDDHTLRLWPVLPPSSDLLCAKLTHNMSRKQWNNVVSPEIPYIEVCPGLPQADDAG